MLTEVIERRRDGTLVGTVNGRPYHILQPDPLWPQAEQMAAEMGDALPIEPAPPPPPPPEPAVVARAQRNALLAASDWTHLADSPLSPEARAAWTAYRAALRDVPQQAGFPDAIDWPGPPGASAPQPT